MVWLTASVCSNKSVSFTMTRIRLRIEELRNAQGWSQRDLAEAAGVRQATISKAESSASVTLKTLEKIADALNVNAAALIEHTRAAARKRDER